MKKLILGAIAFISLMNVAMAANCSVYTRDLVNIHFFGTFDGKKVVGVSAHLGSVIDHLYDRRPSYWTNINDVTLTKVGNKFVGKLDTITNSGVYSPNRGMYIQYFYTLEDGTKGNTQEYFVAQKGNHTNLMYGCYTVRGTITDDEARCILHDGEFDNFKEESLENIIYTSRITMTQTDC